MFKLHRAKTKTAQFFFNILGGNFKIFANSETYKRRQGAIRAIQYLISVFAEGFDLEKALDKGIVRTHIGETAIVDGQILGGEYWFTVHGRNGQVIVTSEMYSREASVNRALRRMAKTLEGVTTWIDETKVSS